MRIPMNKSAKWFGYFSHPIRGMRGTKATTRDMVANCLRCSTIAHNLMILERRIDLYVPADHDEIIALAYMNKILTEKQILALDCMILADRDFLLLYNPDARISSGMRIERDFADAHCIPTFIMHTAGPTECTEFIKFLEALECEKA